MTEDMLHVVEWHNGEKDYSPFSDAEMSRRQDALRRWMAEQGVDAALLTSLQCINYYSGWLYCSFGRKYGMVISEMAATTISAGIDGGQPWRRSFGGNITYTDWRRDNFYRAVRQLTPGVKRLAIEFDHVSIELRQNLEAALPGVEFVDVGRTVSKHVWIWDVDPGTSVVVVVFLGFISAPEFSMSEVSPYSIDWSSRFIGLVGSWWWLICSMSEGYLLFEPQWF